MIVILGNAVHQSVIYKFAEDTNTSNTDKEMFPVHIYLKCYCYQGVFHKEYRGEPFKG